MKRSIYLCALCFLATTFGCTDGGTSLDSSADGDAARVVDAQPPPPVDASGAHCVISADCPSGTHCDLGECIQACNQIDPCSGQMTCTPRGRCLVADAGSREEDPPPVTPSGSLQLSPTTIPLTVGQSTFSITMTAPGLTRYRIESTVPWLSVMNVRGTFTNSILLPVAITPLIPLDGSPGALRVYTSQGQGEVDVSAPTQLQGVYRGMLSFDHVHLTGTSMDAPLTLGATRIGIQLRQDHNVVQARIDPEASTLWPASSIGPAQGSGIVNGNQVALTVTQVISGGTLVPRISDSPSVFQGPTGSPPDVG
ncbi:MAG: hypothetical protein WCK05_12625, partial [Planctomycetota bacterium]